METREEERDVDISDRLVIDLPAGPWPWAILLKEKEVAVENDDAKAAVTKRRNSILLLCIMYALFLQNLLVVCHLGLCFFILTSTCSGLSNIPSLAAYKFCRKSQDLAFSTIE